MIDDEKRRITGKDLRRSEGGSDESEKPGGRRFQVAKEGRKWESERLKRQHRGSES